MIRVLAPRGTVRRGTVRLAGFWAAVLSSGRSLPLTFAVLLVAVATPVFLDPLPPLTDYVNHLARMCSEYGDANPDPDHLALEYEGASFQLYRTIRNEN